LEAATKQRLVKTEKSVLLLHWPLKCVTQLFVLQVFSKRDYESKPRLRSLHHMSIYYLTTPSVAGQYGTEWMDDRRII
jgi:hypothetical protein